MVSLRPFLFLNFLAAVGMSRQTKSAKTLRSLRSLPGLYVHMFVYKLVCKERSCKRGVFFIYVCFFAGGLACELTQVRDCRGAKRPPRERRLKAGKTVLWTVLSESPSSYAAKASEAWVAGA